MESNDRIPAVHVAAAIIRDEEGRFLICKRGPGGNCGGLWEFPGGKLEPGETAEDCLIRECGEELDVTIHIMAPYASFSYEYPDGMYQFSFFTAGIAHGVPILRVHEALRWAPGDMLKEYSFCPADVELVHRLSRETTKPSRTCLP